MAAPTNAARAKALANPEPSTHGTKRQFARCKVMSGVEVKADLPVERPRLLTLTHKGHSDHKSKIYGLDRSQLKRHFYSRIHHER
jgi:hypothetical protein